jgi:glycosyltransferase involved in cell wall biosynthesis
VAAASGYTRFPKAFDAQRQTIVSSTSTAARKIMQATATAEPTQRQRPKFSVIIPTHNRKNLLREAIESVLNQEPCGGDVELIVVDDKSTDATPEVIAEYKQAKYLPSRHGNAAGSRNVGIEQATGEWLAFLDDDDVWLPEKLRLVAASIEKDPEARVIFSPAYICDHLLERGPIWPGPHLLDPMQVYESFLCDVITPSVIVIHREVFDKVGLFDAQFYRAEDRDLCLRIARAGFRFARVAEPLVLYRGRDRSNGDMTRKTFEASMKVLKREFALRHSDLPDWRSRARIELRLRGWYAHVILQGARKERSLGELQEARRLSRVAFSISPPHWIYHQIVRRGK